MTSSNPPLINRLEAADAGSRELDGAIRAQFFDDFFYCDYETGTSCSDAPDCSKDGCYKPLGIIDERTSLPRDWRDDDRLPAYSTSLDAALALVREVLPGWTWDCREQDDKSHYAGLQRGYRTSYDKAVGGSHKSPAIALLIALLKAKD